MNKIIAFDLDDVICKREVEGNNIQKYHHCKPINKMIDIVNKSYEAGNTIIIYTARGMNVFQGDVEKIKENLYDLTKDQLSKWGVKHHKLVMGKIHYDILIDDKAVNSLRIESLDSIKDFFGDKE